MLTLTSDLLHFCWRPRSNVWTEPDADHNLIMFPGDGTFEPLIKPSNNSNGKHSPTNGRIYVLKFSSSSERHYYWMQSKTQHKEGVASWFSQRDQDIGDIVQKLLSGEEDDVESRVAALRHTDGGDGDADDDDAMEDVQGPDAAASEHHRQGSGGAGQGATGGDPRDEGEESRRGGEDGGRA